MKSLRVSSLRSPGIESGLLEGREEEPGISSFSISPGNSFISGNCNVSSPGIKTDEFPSFTYSS